MVTNADIAQVRKLPCVTPADLGAITSVNDGGVLWSIQAAVETMIRGLARTCRERSFRPSTASSSTPTAWESSTQTWRTLRKASATTSETAGSRP